MFHEIAGITVMDLRRQVSRRIPKKKSRESLSENPDVFVTQMDTVYNDKTSGPFIQTFQFINAGLLFALYHESKTALAMRDGVDLLESVLGTELFRKYVHVLLGRVPWIWPTSSTMICIKGRKHSASIK